MGKMQYIADIGIKTSAHHATTEAAQTGIRAARSQYRYKDRQRVWKEPKPTI